MNNAPIKVAEMEVLHRADAQGVRITRLEIIKIRVGLFSVSEFWHDMTTGQLVQVTSRKPTPQEAFGLVGK